MCGIVGLINTTGRPVLPGLIRSAADLLKSRGPDDCGVWTEDNAGFGHRRLSIIDLSPAGHQPMVSPDGRYVIAYNGEVYNFAELKKELSGDKSFWRGDNDTEVVLAAYIKWGPACLSRFQGMFAFAIGDKKERTLFAARDRMGVKPFYYSSSPSCFAFASRPRAVLALNSGTSAEIDPQALRLYLESGYIPAPYSIYQGIRKLPPAHYLLIKGGSLKIERYWDFRHIAPESSWAARKEEDLLEELDEVISRSIRSRMISDVPLGAFLSGGIDSSLVVAVMRKFSPNPVKTFTIGFDEKTYDESSHARAVAEHLGTEHHCESLSVNSLLDLMPVFREQYDEPFFDSSAFPTMAVSRLARKHVTVSLSGDGGDELFGGYHYYRIAQYMAPFFKLPPALRGCAAFAAGTIPKHNFKLLSAALRQPDAPAAFAFARSIAKDFRGVIPDGTLNSTFSIRELFSETSKSFPAGLSPAEEGMRLDAFHTLPDDYLQKVDIGSMAFSLESRDPLLDHQLVEWAMRLPVCWKLRGGKNKYLLRKLAYKYVPESILDRPKQGFGVPIDKWLRGPLKKWAEERLNDRRLFQKLPLDQSAVGKLWDIHESGARNAHPLVWAILMLLDFCDKPGKAI